MQWARLISPNKEQLFRNKTLCDVIDELCVVEWNVNLPACYLQ